jgi:hypothetical protein
LKTVGRSPGTQQPHAVPNRCTLKSLDESVRYFAPIRANYPKIWHYETASKKVRALNFRARGRLSCWRNAHEETGPVGWPNSGHW